MLVRVNVNGEWREADSWEGSSLLSFLRDELHLAGSKNACEQGECGSCSVWLDGTLVQSAFVEAGAVQCGFCTPGFVVAVTDLLDHDPSPEEIAVREALSGNLCRCTGYQKILDAVRIASERRLGGERPA